MRNTKNAFCDDLLKTATIKCTNKSTEVINFFNLQNKYFVNNKYRKYFMMGKKSVNYCSPMSYSYSYERKICYS